MSQSNGPSSIRVAIVEDDVATRMMLADILGKEDGYDVVAELVDGQSAMAALPLIAPDLALIDISLPDISGINVIQLLSERVPNCDVLVLSTLGDEGTVMAALEAGAGGYLLKGCSQEEFKRDIRALREGGSPLSPSVARKLVNRLTAKSSGKTKHLNADNLITRREIHILEFIARGHSYNEAAKACDIAPATVHSHLKSIYRKLKVHSKTEAIYQARSRGLIR